MIKEIERKQNERLVISPKTAELLAHLGEIREVTNGIVRENLILGVFNDTMREMAFKKRMTGFFKASIQSMSGNSWQTFSGESMSLAESLITPENISDPKEGRRGSVLSILFRNTTEQNDAYCRPGGGHIWQDNVTSRVYGVDYDQNHSTRIVLTFGQYYEMTEEAAATTPVPIKTNVNGVSEINRVLQDCCRITFNKINTAMEPVDSVSSFLQAPADVWKKVFEAAA